MDTVKAMEKDILTTAQTAKLLGVSVRTAQLLIEGGSVPSWKTPGGHRRVYRTDIEALIEGGGCGTPSASATVIVITPGDRIRSYEEVFAAVPECEAEIFEDLHAALFALGSARPHAIVVDLADGDVERSGLLHSLVANPSLGHSHILAVGASVQARKTDGLDRVIAIDTPEQAVAAVRRSLADTGQTALPPGALPFPVALNEGQRLVALERSGLLGTAPEETFDRLTWLASQTLKAPISLLTLLTPTQQWFKSRLGLDLPETPRSWAFCNYTILQKGVFSVEDLAKDPRFNNNPAVAGDPGFRFYAGVPVLDNEGFPVGALCVIDYKQRVLDEREAQALSALAALASSEVRLRATERQLREALRREGRHDSARGRAPAAQHAVKPHARSRA
ncbi:MULTISPECIES: GAF domain-containing protein [unclassified Methylobacterium]|uniref:GAF domain-containing protein n=1 Tax=unclassified Methylobacterium TaxID=2615210 RepID=UPI000ADEF63D|nr:MULTISPECIES: GAF domain-containing protein [unclassified Methylobacterium]